VLDLLKFFAGDFQRELEALLRGLAGDPILRGAFALPY